MKNEDELEFMESGANEDDFSSMNASNQGYSAQSGESDSMIGRTLLKQSKNPTALLFHLLFKAMALFVYIFGGWFTTNFILIFVVTIILLAFDFWTVKNVSGRLLVGLRWWSIDREDGSIEYIFESLEDISELSALDSRVFWGALYSAPACWVLLFVVGLLRLQIEFLPIVGAAILMSTANIIGYVKCSNNAKSKAAAASGQNSTGSTMASALSGSPMGNWVLNQLIGQAGNMTSK